MLGSVMLLWLTVHLAALPRSRERELDTVTAPAVYLRQGLAAGRGHLLGCVSASRYILVSFSLSLQHTPGTKDLTPGDYLKLETQGAGAALVTHIMPKPSLLLIMSMSPHGFSFFLCFFLFPYIINAVK